MWEAKRLGIPVRPPDIRYSDWDCTLEGEGIRIGFKYVAGVSMANWRRIVENRNVQSGDPLAGLPAKIIENLSRIGAVPGTGCVCPATRVNSEITVLGMTVTNHPLGLFPVAYTPSREVEEHKRSSDKVTVAGVVIARQTPPTRSGKRIIFLTLQDETGLVDVTVFPDIQQKYAKIIFRSSILKVEGIVRKTGVRGFSITAQKVFAIA